MVLDHRSFIAEPFFQHTYGVDVTRLGRGEIRYGDCCVSIQKTFEVVKLCEWRQVVIQVNELFKLLPEARLL